MAWIMVATPSFASIEQVDAVLAQLDGAPDGMEERYIGTADDGELRVVSLWQSKGARPPVLRRKARARGCQSAPSRSVRPSLGIDVQRSYVRQPVA